MRKLATAAAVSLVLASGGVRALGLGDIEMRSALNQPMNAEIRLTSVQPGEAEGMIVKLASSDAFARAGIERTSVLTDLRFSVDQSTGTPVIRISSTKPVVEPFLNFLLEVDWPAGRMVREYTVLLDPPVFMTPSASDRNTAAEQPAILQRSDTSEITPTPIERAAENFEVEIVGSAVEIADNTVLPADNGDIVSLDDLSASDSALPSVELIDDNAVSLDSIGEQGDIVVLSDLEVINTEAAVQFQSDQIANASDFEFEVEIVGSGSEVSDSFVSGSGQDIGGSEIVSLDSLDAGSNVSGGGGEVRVARGDTLSKIADENAVAGVSPQQMMMALLNANQGAFINGNVNLVKAGAILRIPEASELTQITQAQAIAQLGEQNQLWREYRDNIRGTAGTRLAAAPSAPTATATDTDASAQTELSEAAQRILDAAKDEALNTKELNIVAQSDATTTAASATADNSQASADAQLGAINKKLQLAKEELASTRLESTDLSEQSAELKSTTENMESLVSIRQAEVARLQEELAKASSQAASVDASIDTDATGTAAAELLDNANAAASNATDAVADAANSAIGAGENALTAAGQTLGEVELVDDNATQAAIEAAAAPTTQTQATPWYLDLLQKYGKWLVIGIGALSALIAGVLLLGKRRPKDDDMLDYGDDVEFLDDENDGVQIMGDDAEEESSGIGSAVTAGATGAAAVGGVAAAAASYGDDETQVDAEEQASLGAHMDALDDAGSSEEGLDADDTISEVDVYLAYGLHGQAEELLAKAIDRDPNNSEYALKMLQTQHAQGNADAFAEGAQNYHDRFGGDNAPDWDTVCNLGHDLQPNNILFASNATAVESVGKGAYSAGSTMGADDFATDDANAVAGSVSRDFGDASETATDVNETDLMDQSLDPAFAFDETDLEATGDFSQIANEIATEEVAMNADTLVDDTSLDFPGFDATESLGDAASDIADAGKEKLSDAGDALTDGIGGLAAGGAAVAGGLAATAASAKDSAVDVFDDALSLDDLDSAASAANDGTQGSVAEDLTLDLDQLSGDLELDGTELLDQPSADALDDLEIPDLTSDNELMTDNVANIDGSDEMDTMMDLAKAYIDMGDKDSASSALGEIVKSGNPAQVSEAETLLRKIS